MQSKLLILSLAAIGMAMPSPADDTTQAVAAFDSADNLLLDARAPPKSWQAKGGCQTNWGDRCLNQCKKEAKDKGQTCKLGSKIWKDECWLGWCVCDCYCKA